MYLENSFVFLFKANKDVDDIKKSIEGLPEEIKKLFGDGFKEIIGTLLERIRSHDVDDTKKAIEVQNEEIRCLKVEITLLK